jgi:hypothetical protein
MHKCLGAESHALRVRGSGVKVAGGAVVASDPAGISVEISSCWLHPDGSGAAWNVAWEHKRRPTPVLPLIGVSVAVPLIIGISIGTVVARAARVRSDIAEEAGGSGG